MESYSVMAVLSATDKNFTSTMKGASSTMGNLEDSSDKTRSSILKIAGTAAVFKAVDIATNALVGSLDGAIRRYDTMNKFPRVMEQIGFSTDQSEQSIQRLSAGIDGLPTSLDAITSSTQSIALLTGDLEMATETSLALNNAFLASGSATADAERGLTQYTQMLSKGTVDMQSWRTLQETMGYALRETAVAMGIATGDTNELYAAIQSGEKSFDDMNAALIECSTRTGGFAEVAKTASEGIGTSMQNVKTAMVKGVTTIIEATDKMLADNGFPKLAGIIDNAKVGINASSSAIASSIGVAGKAIKELSPYLKIGATAWVTYEAAMGVTNTIKKVSSGITTAQKAIKIATTETVKMSAALSVGGAASQAVTTKTRAMTLALTASQKATALKTAAEAKGYTINAAGQVVTTKGIVLTKAETVELMASTGAVTAKSLVVAVLTGKEKIATAVQLAWNAAMAANPIGLIITLVAAAAAGVVVLAKALDSSTSDMAKMKKGVEELSESSKELVDSIDSSAKAHKDNIKKINAEASANETLAGKIDRLSSKVKKSTADKALLQSYVDTLNASMENLGLQYDAENDALNMSTTAIYEKVAAYKAQAEAQASQERYTELLREQMAVEDDLRRVQEQREDLKKEEDGLASGRLTDITKHSQAKKELRETEESLIEKQGELADSIQHVEGIMVESAENQAAAVNDSVSSQINLYGNLSESAETALNRIVNVYDTMVSGLTGLNKELVLDTDLTWDKVKKNQEKALDYTEEFSKIYSELIEAGVKESYLNTIGATGPEALPLLRGMQDEGIDAVLAKQGEWEAAYNKVASEPLVDAFQMGGEERAAIIEYVTGGNGIMGSLQSAIDSADWSGTGMFIPEEVAEGIKGGSPLSAAAMEEMVNEVQNAIQPGMFIPQGTAISTEIASGITEGGESVKQATTTVGAEAAAGYVVGLGSGTGAVNTAASTLIEGGIEAARAAQNSHSPSVVYQGLGTDAIAGYVLGVTGSQGALSAAMTATMQVAVNAAKTTMTNGLRSAISSASVAFNLLGPLAKSGMASMNASIKSGVAIARTTFTTIGTVAKSGMTIMNTAINAGMSASNRTIQSKMKSNETITKSGMTAMQTATRSGMNQLTSAINVGMSAANSRVASGTSSMVAKVRGLQSSFYSSGVYASQGLANGINARASAAISAANRLANSVASTMRSALQIHSPSRVTKEIGEYTAEGAAEGILSKISHVQRVSDKLAEAMVPSTDNISDRLAYAGDFSYSHDDMLNYTANHTYTFVIPIQADGREFAKASATFTQEELTKMERMNNRRSGIRS